MALSSPNKLQHFEAGEVKVPKSASKCVPRSLGDSSGSFCKIMVYGKQGTGKTFLMVPLLLDNQRVFVLSTDTGEEGLNTVRAELLYRGREDLLQNVMYVSLPDYDTVDTFLKAPEKICPGIYEWNPDFLFWDGFSNYQLIHIQEEVETDPEVMKALEAGSPLKYWGAVKRETQREFNRFLSLHNKKTGQLIHKVVTMLEDDKHTEAQLQGITSEVEKMKTPKQGKGPLVQGAGGKLMGPGCDIVLRTVRKIRKNEDTKKLEVTYWYETAGTEKVEAKVRGLKLDPVIPADFGVVWGLAKKYYGLVQGAVDKKLVEEEG